MFKKILPCLLLPLLFAGCAAQITNLTPGRFVRNENNLYPFEVAFKSRQQSLRWDSIQPSVVVGTNFFPMQPTALMKNRWETLIPVPPTASNLVYRYRFDFKYNAMYEPQPDSVMSQDYFLQIMDK